MKKGGGGDQQERLRLEDQVEIEGMTEMTTTMMMMMKMMKREIH
jgi:hypothetical protein